MSHQTRHVFTVSRRHFIKAGGAAAALCVGSASPTKAAEAPFDPRWVQQAAATRQTPEPAPFIRSVWPAMPVAACAAWSRTAAW